jgi:hypothetical protein
MSLSKLPTDVNFLRWPPPDPAFAIFTFSVAEIIHSQKNVYKSESKT